jgi:triosephosphate isomerase (TIM)
MIAGNWKLHKTVAEAEAFIGALLPKAGAVEDVDVVICPAYLALQAMVDSTRGSAVQVYAQNMHEADSGAFTGEVSAPMLTEIDVQGVILGHSERRQYFGETDRALQAKVPRALEAGLTPILCVGETEEDKAAGGAVRVLYGGSLKPDNCGGVLTLPDVDGALVGGASLDADDFASIIDAARAR